MSQSINALDLWFRQDKDSKLYKVRIKDPKQDLSREQIHAACDDISRSRAFDFNGLGRPCYLVQARYYRRSSRPAIK